MRYLPEIVQEHYESFGTGRRVLSLKMMQRRTIWFIRKSLRCMNLPIRVLKTEIPVSLPFVVFLFVLINLAGGVCSATARTPSTTAETQASSGSDSAHVVPSIT